MGESSPLFDLPEILDDVQLVLECKLTLEELHILDNLEILRFGRGFPGAGGFCLDEADVLLAFFDFLPIEL
jgi:hypothetical protein